MAEGAPQVEKLVPPYVAWKTFNNFVQYLKTHGVPSVVDRSTMASMSGSSQSQLMAALRFFSLIQATGAPTAALKDLCQADGDAYAKKLQSVVTQAYRETLGDIDLKKTTTGELARCFQAAGISGGTVSTAISFLLAAAKECGIEISGHVRAPSSSSKKRPNGKRRTVADEPADTNSQTTSEQPTPTGAVKYFPIPLPQLGVDAGITLPMALDSSTWQMIKTIVDAYADALIRRNEEDDEEEEAD
jgi:hypothetical protein